MSYAEFYWGKMSDKQKQEILDLAGAVHSANRKCIEPAAPVTKEGERVCKERRS